MAKTAKLKHLTKSSLHSRASRRAASPSLDLDKSLASLKPPKSSSKPSTASFLAAQSGAGISKAKRKDKILRRKQRRRVEHGKEKAEDLLEKHHTKVLGSSRKSDNKKGRRAKWEELNERIDSTAPRVKTGKKKDKKKEKPDLENDNEDGEVTVDDAEETGDNVKENESVRPDLEAQRVDVQDQNIQQLGS